MTTRLQGLGLATPAHFVEQRDALAQSLELAVASSKQQKLAPRLYDMSGVARRHSVLLKSASNGVPATQTFYEPPSDERSFGPTTAARMQAYMQHAAPLAEQAARAALADAGIAASAITHLVTVSCSGFAAPGVDIALIRQLGLPSTTARTHVGFMGCHGALNGLRVAHALAATPGSRVLLVAVELCSLHFQYEWTPQRMVANSLFADGAAAAVIAHGDNGAKVVDSHAELMPDSEDAMSWYIGDHGFDMTLSPRVPELISQHLRPSLTRWLAQHDLRVEQIARWAIHPGGPRILDACAQALDLSETDIAISRDVLSRYGNMSSPTVLFVLDEVLSQPGTGPVVTLGFGPGLALEAALLSV